MESPHGLSEKFAHGNSLGSSDFQSDDNREFPRSRSEQAPGSGFHPRDESDKVDCEFLGPSWFNKKVDPER